MSRERKEFIRKSGIRDARLIIIATEGEKTEYKYFKLLSSKEFYYNSSIQVEVLPNVDSKSAPEYVIALLDNFKKEYKIKFDDELWLVIDFDRWMNKKISNIASSCVQKKYFLAVSNPCVEFWFYLHYKSLDNCKEEEKVKLFKNLRISKDRKYIDRELAKLMGSYNKANPDFSSLIPYTGLAIERAESIDIKAERWPNKLGSRVYLLVKNITNL